ncbi:CHC2 zinc finger domain-containing protein [Roseobacter litoralis]|uniref:CHC2 zinc finger domain-containing protein n=1 Tax=Roseobacter litoralis TaxID=42443 RepID=UPI0024948F26|nr:CHC2 zinc finger domain-containing protein [Roseobacter litoralis]
MALSNEVKMRVSLRALVERDVVWDMHKSNAKRGDFWAPCPLHGEATPSFHITEPKGTGGVFHCFGCGAKGSCIDYIMHRDDLDFVTAVKLLADQEHIDRNVDPARQAEIEAERAARQKSAEDETARKADEGQAKASAIWRAAVPDHPALTTYLEGRGIRLSAIGGVPATLRFHPDLPCYQGQDENGRARLIHRGPAMVGFMGRAKMVGIHRTWIDGPARARTPDGKKVPKQFLGRTGEMFGHPVCLTPPSKSPSTLFVGEGIETTLAALAAALVKSPEGAGVYHAEAALSLGALAGPEGSEKPTELGTNGKPLPSVKIALDSDNPGWLPPANTGHTIILADASARCPRSAENHATRALHKINPRCPSGARLAVPRGRWDHNDDFADLAKNGELYA